MRPVWRGRWALLGEMGSSPYICCWAADTLLPYCALLPTARYSLNRFYLPHSEGKTTGPLFGRKLCLHSLASPVVCCF